MYIKNALASIVLALGLASSPAYSYVLTDGTDVGGLDTFIAETTTLANSSEAVETAWASGEAGTTLTFSGKTDPAEFQVVQGETSIIAFLLKFNPTYFLVKDAQKHVLFKNEIEIDWGVFNLATYFPSKDPSELELSHLTEFNGNGDVPVSEPATALLLAIGIFGLVANRKRVKKSV
ncbi:PEP-CTERM sorting domain-containing protein [Marinobacter changyiensis]|uniref:PEP-CTERM sorting domain-containing protein n=1 Tax=Marinobacter changyiensis TaxID=2604091 RepID=UPI00126451E3|nr:PEP-CTERM sorting domain-containing protein [Marinobacter changyiensis]